MKIKIIIALFIAALCTSKALAQYGNYRPGSLGGFGTNYQSPSFGYNPTCTYGYGTPVTGTTYPSLSGSGPVTTYYSNGATATTYPSLSGTGPVTTYYNGF